FVVGVPTGALPLIPTTEHRDLDHLAVIAQLLDAPIAGVLAIPEHLGAEIVRLPRPYSPLCCTSGSEGTAMPHLMPAAIIGVGLLAGAGYSLAGLQGVERREVGQLVLENIPETPPVLAESLRS